MGSRIFRRSEAEPTLRVAGIGANALVRLGPCGPLRFKLPALRCGAANHIHRPRHHDPFRPSMRSPVAFYLGRACDRPPRSTATEHAFYLGRSWDRPSRPTPGKHVKAGAPTYLGQTCDHPAHRIYLSESAAPPDGRRSIRRQPRDLSVPSQCEPQAMRPRLQ